MPPDACQFWYKPDMRVLSAVLALVLCAAPSRADEIDDFVRAEIQRQRLPGVSVAICRDGRLVKAEGYGLANVEHQVAATADTVYQSGSVGKQFTATAIMMLVEQGKVGLDDPMAKYFEQAPPSWASITIRHLLTHTSGIKDYEEGRDIDYRRDYTEVELEQVAKGLPPDFPPGAQWSYSNTAYVLLGILIHKVSGQFYGDFLRDRVFAPLGMATARVITEEDIVPNRAAGYRLVDGQLKNQEWVAPRLNTTADGSLYFTVRDLVKWDAALYGTQLLRAESLREMWTPVRLANGATYPYGFGWAIQEQRGFPNIEHGGAWQGFRTHIARYVDQRLSVIVLTNLAQGDPEAIAHGIAGLVEPALRLPDPRSARPDPDPTRAARLRSVLRAWASNDPSEDMAAGLRAARAGTPREMADRKRTATQLEKLSAFGFLAEDDVEERGLERRGAAVHRIVHYGLIADDKAYEYRFYLDAAGKVADFTSEAR